MSLTRKAPTPAIIENPADITADWLSAVLGSAGHDATVTGFDREPVGTGQMAHNERYSLTFATGASDAAPSSLVIKFPSPSEESRAAGAAGGYSNEVKFYTELAAGLSITIPDCLYGAVADDSTVFTLVLEDLAPSLQGNQIDGASDAQVLAAAENLAGLHAPRWDDPTLTGHDWLTASGANAVEYIEMVTPMFIDRYQDRLSVAARTVFATFGANAAAWIEQEPTVHTLVHGDYRLDNLMFATGPDSAPVSTVDWQTVGVGSGGRDVAYLLGTSADASHRRRQEQPTLDAYRSKMRRLGVDMSAAEVTNQYVHGTFQGPFITMLGSIMVGQTNRGDAMFMAMAERSAAQIIDLDALDLIV